MLQISNVEDGKHEWNVNETHIIIPMIDGDVIAKDSDKISANTITLNALEGGDQTIITNGLEHSFVIGLDRNLFDSHPNKSDLLVIQNSDLKLLSCNPDLKNPVAYTLTYVDQERNEILWESPVLKERGKSEWSERAIFEVKDSLNYDEVQDSSKNWRDDLEKNNQQINLDDDGEDLTSVTKIHEEILIPVEETSEGRTGGSERDAHYIVNYYPTGQNGEEISILPNPPLASPKSVIQQSISKNEFVPEEKELKSDFVDAQVSIMQEEAMEFTEYVPAPNSNHFIQCDTEMKENIMDEQNATKDSTVVSYGVARTLPEKSLPLKKKAKMKRTMVVLGDESKLPELEKNSVMNTQNKHIALEKIINRPQATNVNENDSSESDEPLTKKVVKVIKGRNRGKAFGSPNRKKGQEDIREKLENSGVERRGEEKLPDSWNTENEPNDIYAVVDSLRKSRFINGPLVETLKSGLKELQVDILEEMKSKREEKRPMKDSSYSPQLKAFALVLYFKQPAAFHHLAKVYGNGWPSLNVIKEWKKRMNSHQRPGFAAVNTEAVIKS